MSGWIGVNLDGTLAEYHGFDESGVIGEPIDSMVDRVRGWLESGWEVRIFTARIYSDGSPRGNSEAKEALRAIGIWSQFTFGRKLPVTNVKDYGMVELWDDRAVQVEKNTGKPLSPGTRGL